MPSIIINNEEESSTKVSPIQEKSTKIQEAEPQESEKTTPRESFKKRNRKQRITLTEKLAASNALKSLVDKEMKVQVNTSNL